MSNERPLLSPLGKNLKVYFKMGCTSEESNAAQRRYWPRWKTFALEDFHYEEAADHYLCPQGKRLRRIAKKAYGDGLVRRIYVAEEQDCQPYLLQLRCFNGRGGRKRHLRVPVGVELTNFSKRMAGKVDSEMGRKIYPQRFAVAEPFLPTSEPSNAWIALPSGER